MTRWQYDNDTKSGVLSVAGGLTIAHVAELKERLLEAFSSAEAVTVDVSAATALDVAGIQLLCASHSFACNNGKSMCLELGDNDMVAAFLDEVGFSRNFVCNKSGDDECLWNNTH